MFQPSEYSLGQVPAPDSQVLIVAGLGDIGEQAEAPAPAASSLRTVLSITTLVTSPVAMAVSYKRNKSLGWAFLSGLVSIPYLIYTQVIDKDPK